MARSKNYLTYPEPFHDFIRVAVAQEVRIPCETETEASKLRGTLYGFFGALEASSKKADTPEDIRDLRRMSTKIKLVVEGKELVGYPRDMDPQAMRIADALRRAAPGKPMPSTDAFRPSAELLDFAEKARED